jgi:hypothetical protein
MSVQFRRADKLVTRLRAARLDTTLEAEMRLAMTSDTLFAQSAIDRLTQGAHTLVIEGPSLRQLGTLNRLAAIDEN